VLAPLSWLRDFAPFELEPAELAATFNDLGMVVAGIRRVGEGLADVVVARVLEVSPIAGAQRIRRVSVDAGAGPLEVVCGAFNFGPGDLVAYAPAGSRLPGGLEISRRRIRGVDSEGMLCSGHELGLSEDHSGILVVPPGAEPGTPLSQALGVEPDVVFDLEIETNRPDALCMAGVARDGAARLGLPFRLPEPRLDEAGPPVAELASLEVEAPELCPAFTVRVLTGVSVGQSPAWMRRRLTLAGMRPINSVVDASNYVMLELGQPTHPYDLDRLGGQGIVVRAARPGEVVVTLDGEERRLGTGGPGEPDCVICDAESRPVGIAGIMGGRSSEISASTSRVLLETAYFAPMAIARTAKRLGLRTEASGRFERGCDPEGLVRAADRVCELLGAGPTLARGMLEVRHGPPRPAPVRLRTSRLNQLLGTDLDDDQVAGYLEPIGFRASRPEPGILEVAVPGFRPDATREVDLVEEVARHLGYGRIPRTVPAIRQVGGLTPRQAERRLLARVLADAGADEAWTPTLLAPEDHPRAGIPPPYLRVENPLAREESVLRRSLLPGLLKALAYNGARRQQDLRMFEVGHVFSVPAGPAELPEETEVVAAVLAREGDGAAEAVGLWRLVAEALRLRSVELVADASAGMHPTRSARLVAQGDGPALELGRVGEVDPGVLEAFGLSQSRVGYLELDVVQLGRAPRRPPEARPVSRFPSSDFDLAFVVADAVPASALERTLAEAAGPLLESLRLFDVYRGAPLGRGERSLAFRLRVSALDRTLTDSEVAEVRRRCISAVEAAHGARLR
jgi:phenylalanyl-tRNA synthetase beta chain